MRRFVGPVVLVILAASLALPARADDRCGQRTGYGGRDTRYRRDENWYSPFEELERIQKMMERLFEEGRRGDDWLRARPDPDLRLDIQETESGFIIRCDLPGMEKEKIEVSLKENVLTISGTRERIVEEKDESASYYRSERSFGSFSRSVRLPAPVDEKNIEAEYKDGVLTVVLEKLEKKAPGGVKIRVL